MLKNKFFYSVFVVVSIFSCKEEVKNGAYYGEQYCKCIKEKSKKVDNYSARALCQAELIQSSSEFRIVFIMSTMKPNYPENSSREQRDSIERFIMSYHQYTQDNCCKAVENCESDE